MQEILTLLGSPVFWFGSVLVGIIIGIAGNFAADGIKQYWGRFSASQRSRNEEERRRIIKEAKKCIDNLPYLVLRNGELNTHLLSTVLLLLMVTLFIIAGLMSFAVAVDSAQVIHVLESDFLTSFTQLSVMNVLLTTSPAKARFWYGIISYLFMISALWSTWQLYRESKTISYLRIVMGAVRYLLDKQMDTTSPDGNTVD